MLIRENRFGFTLIEVLIAIAILLIGAVAIVPLFVFASDTAETNKRRTIAANLANAQIEYIRSLNFEDIGIYPNGKLEDTSTEFNGVEYRINFDVVEDIPGHSKRVEVEVVAAATGRQETIREQLQTVVAKSGPEPGGIRITAIRGWQPESSQKRPVGNVEVTVTRPDSFQERQFTGIHNGEASFVIDREKTGTYTVTTDPPEGMIMFPSHRLFELDVPGNGWVSQEVLAEEPCSIDVELLDAISGKEIMTSGTLFLKDNQNIYPGGIETSFTKSPVSIKSIWPLGPGYRGAYQLVVKNVAGYYASDGTYNKPRTASGEPWDGTFAYAGEPLYLTLYLFPIPPIPEDEYVLLASDNRLKWQAGNSHNIHHNPAEDIAVVNNYLVPVKFISSAQNNMNFQLVSGKTVKFTAAAMYFVDRGLSMKNGSKLTLRGALFRFGGQVVLDVNNTLTLEVPPKEELDPRYRDYVYDGEAIAGGEAGQSYGVVYFEGELKNGNSIVQGEGAYFFPDGVKLPEQSHRLIPWHKIASD